eukprot:485225-Rhodomonas_salina.1
MRGTEKGYAATRRGVCCTVFVVAGHVVSSLPTQCALLIRHDDAVHRSICNSRTLGRALCDARKLRQGIMMGVQGQATCGNGGRVQRMRVRRDVSVSAKRRGGGHHGQCRQLER